MSKCTVPDVATPVVEARKYYKLWIIEYTIRGTQTKGIAVVKSTGANKAIQVLKSSGAFNGTPQFYDIQRCEQIDESPEEMLICEQYINPLN